MKPVSIILFSLFVLQISAQVVVKGLVTEQNSGGKMLPGVEIKPLSGIPEVSDNAGLFQLTFADKKPGDRIYVEVNKKGYEVVNRKEILEDWLIEKDPKERTKVVMCPEGMVAQNMAKYYRISEEALTEGYRGKIDALIAERDQAKIDAKQYAEQAKLLEDQFNNQRKQLDELAEKFARENFDDYSGVQKQAADTFMDGNIEEALRILGTVDSEEEIAKAMHQKEKGAELIAEGKQMQEEADSIIQQNIRKLMFQADLYKTTFRFDDAEKAYETAVNADTTNFENIFIYANFLSTLAKSTEAIKWYNTALRLAESDYQKATVLNNLSVVQRFVNQYKLAVLSADSSLSIYRILEKLNPGRYTKNIISGINNAAFLKKDMGQFKESAALFSEALSLEKDSSNINNLSAHIMTSTNLGILYLEMKDYKAAESCFLDVFKKVSMLVNSDPTLYKSVLALATNNIAFVQKETKDYQNSLNNYKKTLQLYRELVQTNPRIYNPYLAYVLFNYAGLYSNLNDFDQSEKNYINSINLYRELTKINPKGYEVHLAAALNGLAMIQKKANQYNDAEINYKESMSIYRDLLNDNPDVYTNSIASILHNLGELKQLTGHYEESINYLNEALEIRKAEVIKYPRVYEWNLSAVLTDLAYTQQLMKQYDNSEKNYMEALSIRKRLSTVNPQVYNYDYAITLQNLATLQVVKKEFDDAIKNYSEAVNIFQALASKDPNAYYPELCRVMSNYAILLARTNQNENTELIFNQALTIMRQIAPNNPDVYNKDLPGTLWEFASLKRKTGKNTDAENALNELVGILEKLVVEYPPKYAMLYMNSLDQLASVQLENKNFEKAEASLSKSLSFRKRMPNDNTKVISEVAATYNNLAFVQMLMNLRDKARLNYAESVKIYRSLITADFKAYASAYALTLSNASWNEYKNSLTGAINYGDEAIGLYQKINAQITEDKSNYAICLSRMAKYMILSKDFIKAEKYAVEANNLIGDQFVTCKNLAYTLLFLGRYEDALQIFNRFFKNEEIQQFISDLNEFEQSGVTHPDVAKVRELLKNK